MAVTWYTVDGQPSDSVGSDGDLNFARTTRMVWGPKGAISAGSWLGTANSNIGPTGPAMLAGQGAPASGYGQQGNGYTDVLTGTLYLKSSSGWAQTGSLQVSNNLTPILQGSGPPNASTAPTVVVGQAYLDTLNSLFYPPATSASAAGFTVPPINVVGPPGPSMQVQPLLGNFAAGFGPACQLNNVTLATAGTYAYATATTNAMQFVPQTASAFMGLQSTSFSNSGGNLVASLVNTTTGATVYTNASQAKGSVGTYGPYTATQYPLIAGNNYQWLITGTSPAYINLVPQYLYPASSVSSVSTYQNFVLPSAVAISTTATIMQTPGCLTQTGYYRNTVASYLYSAQFQLTGTGTAQFQLMNGTTVVYTSPTVTAGNVVNVGPFGVSAAYLALATNYTWQVIGSGTASASVQMTVCQ